MSLFECINKIEIAVNCLSKCVCFIQEDRNYLKEEGENSYLLIASLNRCCFNMLPNNK